MKPTGNKFGVGCMVLFALPFFAVGVGTTWWCFHIVLRQLAMQSWVETPATITQAELKAIHNDGTTYQAIAVYNYEFNGKSYVGKQVGIDSGSDNVGEFQQDAYREIKGHLDKKQPFRCFVDPQRPSDAVLYRDLRGEMITFYTLFASLFGSIGLGLATAVTMGARQAPSIKDNVPTETPWTQRADWEAGLIPSNTNTRVMITTLTAVVAYWLIAMSPLLWKLPEVLSHSSGFWKWGSFAFPFVWILLIVWLVYLKIRARKFGESTLLLASTPGVIGGQLAGVVRVVRSFEAADGFRFTLKCLDWVTSGNSRSEKTAWEDEQLVTEPMHGDGEGTAIPVLFAIPFDCLETTRPGQPGSIHWRLYATASVPGVDYSANFDVPVFKTRESRPDFKLDEGLVSQISSTPNRDAVLREAMIHIELLANGVRLVFPMMRHILTAIFFTIFTAVFGAVTWVLHSGSPFMAVVFGLFTVLLALSTLDFWFYRSVSEASPSELILRGGLLGIGRTRIIPADDIQEFSLTEGMSSGTNVWNNVVVVLKDGKKRTVGRLVPSKLAAQTVIEELTSALKLPTKPNRTEAKLDRYGAP